mgnify:CR=1 FL=1
MIFSQDKLPVPSLVKDLNGKKVNINDLNDTPMVINFWFLACEPCIKEMKYLDVYNTKYEKYGFKVISVNTDNSRTFNRVKPFVKSKKYSFDVYSDPKSLFFRKLGGLQCPYLVVVDGEGNLINKHIGYNPGDEIKLEKEIVELLASSIKSDTSLTDTSIINKLPKEKIETKTLEDKTPEEIDSE